MVNIAVVGASGRMGRAIAGLAAAQDDVRLVGAIVRPESAAVGEAVPGWPDLRYVGEVDRGIGEADVVLDFSAPGASESLADRCAKQGRALLVGTTGLASGELERLEQAARETAVLIAPNTSMGVNLLIDLVRRAATALGEQYDIEILEAHHNRKADAPSGTALRLGEEAAAARGQTLESVADHQREGQTGPRTRGNIGFSVIRGGDIAGEHTVYFAGPGERIELTHRASSRDTFAQGAIDAARWLGGRPPGLYRMTDVVSGESG